MPSGAVQSRYSMNRPELGSSYLAVDGADLEELVPSWLGRLSRSTSGACQ